MKNTKKYLTLSLLTCMMTYPVISAEPQTCAKDSLTYKQKLADIRKTTADINNSKQLTTKKKTFLGHSTEGGEAIVYSLNNQPVKIVVEHLGEMGKRNLGYYFSKGDLRFVFEKTTSYNAPIYDKAFDKKSSTTTYNRYYFYCGAMIRWLDNDKVEVPQNTGIYKTAEKALLEETFDFE